MLNGGDGVPGEVDGHGGVFSQISALSVSLAMLGHCTSKLTTLHILSAHDSGQVLSRCDTGDCAQYGRSRRGIEDRARAHGSGHV